MHTYLKIPDTLGRQAYEAYRRSLSHTDIYFILGAAGDPRPRRRVAKEIHRFDEEGRLDPKRCSLPNFWKPLLVRGAPRKDEPQHKDGGDDDHDGRR